MLQGGEGDDEALLVKFWVTEQTAKAEHPQEGLMPPVWTDSCCELFLAHKYLRNGVYMNFETSAAGVSLAHIGVKGDRGHIADATPGAIVTVPSLGKKPFGPRNMGGREWSLAISIPKAVLQIPLGVGICDVGLCGNAYKCGDDLPVPHWVTLFPIDTDPPDFHRPDGFQPFIFSQNAQWVCPSCTYVNTNSHAPVCEMCQGNRFQI